MKRKVEERKKEIREIAKKKAEKRLAETKQKCPYSGLPKNNL